MNKHMAHRPHPHAIADIINQSQNSFHCIYIQHLQMPLNTTSGNCWQQIIFGIKDKNYLKSLLYGSDSIILTVILSITSTSQGALAGLVQWIEHRPSD